MNLTELDPRWIVGAQWKNPLQPGAMFYNQSNCWNRNGMGISFECPLHRCHRLAVYFKNPVDGGPHEDKADEHLWKRTGDTFETLTLEPSINASGQKVYVSYQPLHATACWHGYIRDGKIITC